MGVPHRYPPRYVHTRKRINTPVYLWCRSSARGVLYTPLSSTALNWGKRVHSGNDGFPRASCTNCLLTKYTLFSSTCNTWTTGVKRPVSYVSRDLGLCPIAGISLSRARARDKGIHIGHKTPK